MLATDVRMVLMTRLRCNIAFPAVFAAAVLVGCGGSSSPADQRVEVVASFYPLAWAAEQVGGGDAVVTNLTPVGAEPHEIDLAPDEIERLGAADVAIVMGRGFQPAVEAATGDRSGATLAVLDEIPLPDDDSSDPHVWLDPALMGAVADAIATALIDADPGNAADYAANVARFRRELDRLDTEYASGLADCARRELFTSHDAFGWLARRYDLHAESIAGVSPDEEPTPQRLADLKTLVEETGATTIYVETLVSPAIAATLAAEAGGLRTSVLNPLEGLSDAEIAEGADYVSVMRENLAALRDGLDCG